MGANKKGKVVKKAVQTRTKASAPLSRPPLARMLYLHERLEHKRLPNCTTMAECLEVSRKTIQRDFDFMRDQLHLPIEYDQARHGYYYSKLVKSFPLVDVTEGELLAVFVGLKAVEQYRGAPFASELAWVFEKLQASLGERMTVQGGFNSSFSIHASSLPCLEDAQIFYTISEAMTDGYCLQIEYQKLNSAVYPKRLVEPYHLACVSGQWYLFAFDRMRGDMRRFVLSRMRSASISKRKFDPAPDFSIEKELEHCLGIFEGKGKHDIRIRFDAWAAQLIRERTWHPHQKLKELKGGELEFSITLSSLAEVESWVLSFGGHAEVLAPEDFVQKLRQTTRVMAETYSGWGSTPIQ